VETENQKKFNSPLIILDPIDYNRNLGSAISSVSVGTLILSSRAFLKNPNANFFTNIQKNFLDPSIIELYSSNILIIEFEFSFRSPDIIWGQLQKASTSISKSIEIYGFNILKKVCFTDENEHGVMAFLLDSITIPKFYKRIGPDILRKNDTEKFVKSNSKSNLKWLGENDRINCILYREYTDIRDYLKFLIEEKHDLIGIPKGLKLDFMSTVQIYTLDQQKNISEYVKDTVFELLYTDARIF
jgi:tRNA nucleotidyltransferase (CCA-adding enzyme)